MSSGGKLAPFFDTTGAEHVVCPISIRSPRVVLRGAREFRTIVDDRKIDLIHVFSASAATIAKVASLVPGRRSWPPVVSSIMGLENAPDEARVITHLRNYLCTVGAARVFIISPAIGRLVRRLPVRRRRLVDRKVVGIDTTFGGHVDPASLSRAREELGLADDSKLVLTIGALEPRKSHELFVRAAEKVVSACPAALFAIVGEGTLRPDLENEILQRRLGACVKLLGLRHDIATLLTLTDVYVKPGIVEGFIGITVLEAQAVGRPVVAFETEDVKLAIQDGVTGILAPCGRPDALADAILRLLRNPEEARRIAAAGQARARAEYGIEAVSSGLLEEYRSLLGQRSHPVAERTGNP